MGGGAVIPAVRMQSRTDMSLTVIGGIRGPGIRVTVQGHEGTDCLLGGIAASLQHVLQRHPGIAGFPRPAIRLWQWHVHLRVIKSPPGLGYLNGCLMRQVLCPPLQGAPFAASCAPPELR